MRYQHGTTLLPYLRDPSHNTWHSPLPGGEFSGGSREKIYGGNTIAHGTEWKDRGLPSGRIPITEQEFLSASSPAQDTS